MDSGGGQTTSTSTSQPWSGAQPYLTDLMSQAKGLYNQGSQYAPFSTVAPFSPQTLQGLDMTQNMAQNGTSSVNAANGALTNLLQASPTAINPYLNQMYQAASKPVIDSVNAQFGMGGRTGSAANQDALTTQLGNLSANIYGTGYENAANRNIQQGNQQIAASTVAPQIQNAGYTNAQNLLNVGGQYDTQANKYIQDALARWNYGQDQPWNLLSRYAGNITGLGQYPSSSGTATQPGQSVLPLVGAAGVNLLSQPSSQGAGSIFANLLHL